FQCALDDLTYRPNHCRNLILSVLKTQAGRVLNERCLPSGAIQEQLGHTCDNVPKRGILDEHLIRTKARCEQPNDVEGDVGMMSQEVHHLGWWKESDRAVGHRDCVCRKGFTVKNRDFSERPAWPKHFQHLLTTLG